MFRVKNYAISLLIVSQMGQAVLAVGPASETAIRSAWTLYTQQKYVPSADAFEALIKTSTPGARLYYYAAAANRAGGRMARAKQLCQYIVANFSGSPEAGYAQKLFPELAPSVSGASAGVPAGLPAHLKGKSVDELMETEEGRQALNEALNKTPNTSGSASSSAASRAQSSATASSRIASSAAGVSILRPADAAFSADIIAVEAADGITHFGPYSRSEFECSLAALAMLSRGRELLASMIRCPSAQDIYIVRFPGPGGEYQVTPQKMEQYRIRDKALWATVIHCAEWMSNSKGDIEDGLSLLTGKTAQKVFANNTTEQALTKFIVEAVSAQNPIVCLSADDFGTLPELAENYHAYTITGFDSGTGMITIRNPHGANSPRFRLKDDPEHKKFEQLNDGVFKMHVSLFPKYFSEVARSTI